MSDATGLDLETIFSAALAKQSPEERAAYLEQACAGDEGLRRKAECLLKAYPGVGSFLEQSAAELLGTLRFGQHDIETVKGGEERFLSEFLSPCDKPDRIGNLGPYEVLEVVGRGGMGIVLRAHDVKFNRIVAIKVMAPELAANPTAVRRFLREAQSAAAVSHDHVVTIHAVDDSQRLPFLVMEFVQGQSLQARLDQEGPLTLNEILRIGMQIASGLAVAHKQGVIHRDVKPANILLENGVERVKITDFGLARAADEACLTQTGMVSGTPQYMSPEQARGEAVDCRTDLFSLGSVLYAMCTGHGPFRAEHAVAVLRRVSDDSPRAIGDVNSDIPEWLAQVVDKLQAKDPADRFQSAGEVADLLRQYLAHSQQPSVVPLPAATPPRSSERQSGLAPQQAPRLSLPSRRLVTPAALLLLASSLGLTEATGVTGVVQFVGAVLRISTPDGVLVVEVDDPQVQVTIEGDGGIKITGAGPQEVRLRPGLYRVQLNGDSMPLHTELVQIRKGKTEVVTVTLEPKGPVAAAAAVRSFVGHTGAVYSVAITPDGQRIVSGSTDGSARVWDVSSGKNLIRFEGHQFSVYSVAVSADGRRVLSGSGGASDLPLYEGSWSVCLWDLESGKELHRLEGKQDSVTAVAFSADGQRALIGTFQGAVLLLDVSQWKVIKRFADFAGLWSARLSPDERLVVTAGGHNDKPFVRLWDLEQTQPLRLFEGHHDYGCWSATFSPHGRRIASAGVDGTVRLWNVESGKEIQRFRTGHVATSAAFSSDGKYLISGNLGSAQTVRLWNVETGQELKAFTGHTVGVQAVAMSRDGRWAVSGGHDRAVRLWELPPEVRQNVTEKK